MVSIPKKFDKIKTLPIPDAEIMGAVVPIAMLAVFEDLLEDWTQRIADMSVPSPHLWEAIGELFFVCAQLTDEKAHREALYQSHRRAAREAARLTLPLWVWRIEREGRQPDDIRAMLETRARFLAGERRVSVDDCWDLLAEFCRDWLRVEPDEALLRLVTDWAYSDGGGA